MCPGEKSPDHQGPEFYSNFFLDFEELRLLWKTFFIQTYKMFCDWISFSFRGSRYFNVFYFLFWLHSKPVFFDPYTRYRTE